MHDTTHWTGQVRILLLWISTGGNFLVMEKQKLVENDDRVFDLFRVRVVHSLLPNSDGDSSEELFPKIKSHRYRGGGKEVKQKETRASRGRVR